MTKPSMTGVLVTIFKYPAAAYFSIEIQVCKTNTLFDTDAQVIYIENKN